MEAYTLFSEKGKVDNKHNFAVNSRNMNTYHMYARTSTYM